MAEVFLARLNCTGNFEKYFALKLLRSSLALDPQYLEMFFHEARVVASLHHPNIVQVLELGEDRGRYFMAMEYLQGVTVAQIFEEVESGRQTLLDPGTVCAIVMQACEGLHFVHEATDDSGKPMSLVHLDVSPQNLFLTCTGSVKLIDFGIAHSNRLAPAVAPSPFRGKLSYASPEQLDGALPDRRSDVFSLGTVLWELLAGQSLFKGRNPLECLYRINEAPIPSLLEFRDDIPGKLDAIVVRALERNPKKRYQSALHLLSDLRQVTAWLGPPVPSYELELIARKRALST